MHSHTHTHQPELYEGGELVAILEAKFADAPKKRGKKKSEDSSAEDAPVSKLGVVGSAVWHVSFICVT